MGYFVISTVSDGDLFLGTWESSSEEEGMFIFLLNTGFFDDEIPENVDKVDWPNFERKLKNELTEKYGGINEAFWYLTEASLEQVDYKFLG